MSCYSGLEEQTAKDINSRLRAAKTYLKTDYKIHVSRADPCPDHCSVYALSTEEPEYQGYCEHEHNIICDRCDNYRNVLVDLQQSLSSCAVKYRCVYGPVESLHCSQISIFLYFYLRKARTERMSVQNQRWWGSQINRGTVYMSPCSLPSPVTLTVRFTSVNFSTNNTTSFDPVS